MSEAIYDPKSDFDYVRDSVTKLHPYILQLDAGGTSLFNTRGILISDAPSDARYQLMLMVTDIWEDGYPIIVGCWINIRANLDGVIVQAYSNWRETFLSYEDTWESLDRFQAYLDSLSGLNLRLWLPECNFEKYYYNAPKGDGNFQPIKERPRIKKPKKASSFPQSWPKLVDFTVRRSDVARIGNRFVASFQSNNFYISLQWDARGVITSVQLGGAPQGFFDYPQSVSERWREDTFIGQNIRVILPEWKKPKERRATASEDELITPYKVSEFEVIRFNLVDNVSATYGNSYELKKDFEEGADYRPEKYFLLFQHKENEDVRFEAEVSLDGVIQNTVPYLPHPENLTVKSFVEEVGRLLLGQNIRIFVPQFNPKYYYVNFRDRVRREGL